MKRVFIFISTILFSCYLVTMIVQQNQQISFSSYNAVDVTGQALTDHKVSNRKEVTDALTNLANEHNSLIARRIVQPNEKGEIDFRYQFYGHVSPPSNLKRASQESAEGSDIVSNYLIVSGDLKGAELISTFSQLGYNAVDFSSYSILSLLLTILLNEVSLISFALFLLTFASLVLIYRIKDLRDAGIKLVSGQSMMKVMLSSFIYSYWGSRFVAFSDFAIFAYITLFYRSNFIFFCAMFYFSWVKFNISTRVKSNFFS